MILVAIGANLPSADGKQPADSCIWAVARLAEIAGLQLMGVSPWYRTSPMPPSGQPDYVNGVVALAGEIDPATLLVKLQEIEAAAGRTRGEPNAARTLDLDIIDMYGRLRDAPDPVLPHPRAHLRAFVLYPLRDLAPDWLHPRLGQSIGALSAGIDDQDIHPLELDAPGLEESPMHALDPPAAIRPRIS